jgi:hypothetical protein
MVPGVPELKVHSGLGIRGRKGKRPAHGVVLPMGQSAADPTVLHHVTRKRIRAGITRLIDLRAYVAATALWHNVSATRNPPKSKPSTTSRPT